MPLFFLTMNMQSTIAAISTSYVESGIGIIRMSGPNALEIFSSIFVMPKNIEKPEPRHMYYGTVQKDGQVLDEALGVYFKGPNSYTGEDMVEIQCHGSLVALKNILALCLESGAEAAERGEFTKRAFLNGKLDLVQAEAVIDLIKAKTNRSFDVAVAQKEGRLSEKIRAVRTELIDLLVLLDVNLDYPDEDIEEATYEKTIAALRSIGSKIEKLLSSSGEGKILRDGLAVTIAGRPNVGKSSLMNLLLSENRSIVTDIAGTTRDTIEENCSINGIPVRLTDTAGIRKTDDLVEALGVERSKDAFNKADLILLVLDSSQALTKEDEELLDMASGRPCIVLLNKQDLAPVLQESEIQKKLPSVKIIGSSFIRDDGIDEFKKAFSGLVELGSVRRGDALVSNERHIRLLKDAASEIEEALSLCETREAFDFIEVCCKESFDKLGEIIGETATDQIINEIFSRFCLGK